jgi:hypothetical protein
MATRGPRFTAIPSVPQQGLTDWQFNTLNAMKENIELLIGSRGSDNSVRAIVSGQVTVSNPAAQTMTRVTASGSGYTLNNVTVPSLDDYVKLVSDVQLLANDVAALRTTLNTLINQLRG